MLSRRQRSLHQSPSVFQWRRGWPWRNATCVGAQFSSRMDTRLASCAWAMPRWRLTGLAVSTVKSEELSIVLNAVSAAHPLPPPAAIETWDRNQRQPRSRLFKRSQAGPTSSITAFIGASSLLCWGQPPLLWDHKLSTPALEKDNWCHSLLYIYIYIYNRLTYRP